jgi:RNA polymerase sigma-70 factor (ECF subfamily)
MLVWHMSATNATPASVSMRCFAVRRDRPHRYAAQGVDASALERRSLMQDEALVERIGRGDHDAFAALYDHHSALVFGVARRMLGDGPQSEDVTQSVFMQVWTRPESFRGGNFGAWIARVTRNACLDILRSASVRLREPELPADVAADGAVDDEVFARVRAESVNAALAGLPDDQRVAIEQAYFEGLSYREVAERLGAPLGTVKSRIRMGLRRLWETMGQEVPT